jgi:superfamily II DNA/RNA helicase
MVATEAAGEGINLQFCNIMINYDIPWNPNRLEQRMGRIHRYGQTREVFIYNLVAENTREGKVLLRLLNKLEEIKKHLGDKVFDVIGEIFYGKKLYQLVLEAAANARDIDEILKEIEVDVDEEYLRRVREALGDSLAIREIDYTRIKDISEKCKKYRLAPEYTEAFFIKAFKKAGGKIAKVKDYYRTDSIPYEIRKIAEDERFKNTYGSLAKKYAKITFDKEIAMKNSDVEFVSFGHPLFEAVLEWVLRNYLDKCKIGAVFKDVSGVYDGIIWFFEGEVKDGTGEIAGKRLFAIYDDGYNFKEINPAIIWDLVPATDVRGIEIENIDERKEKAKRFAIMSLMEYKNDILKERERQADIKRRYGIKSLENLISELDSKLLEYYEKKESEGKKMDLPIVMAERRKKEYEEALERLKEEIERQKNLTVSMPEFVGAIRVISERKMVSDKEVERIGMEIAMAYERLEGRNPIDVSSKNLGYDIYSEGNGDVRYIEVKARATTGEIALTPNEWFMAKRFKDKYWLYIVENAVMNPTLYIINNPAENLNAIEKVEVVRFVVPTNEWKFKGTPKKVKLNKKE